MAGARPLDPPPEISTRCNSISNTPSRNVSKMCGVFIRSGSVVLALLCFFLFILAGSTIWPRTPRTFLSLDCAQAPRYGSDTAGTRGRRHDD